MNKNIREITKDKSEQRNNFIKAIRNGKLSEPQAMTDLLMKTETYNMVLQHRKICEKWENEFCEDCFGGGLVKFIDDLFNEIKKLNKKPPKYRRTNKHAPTSKQRKRSWLEYEKTTNPHKGGNLSRTTETKEREPTETI